nr:putative ribonuclease H-like domain-containing protein [Tanacetum cinerariifolium]
MLYMDLVGPTTVKSLMKKSYCLVITDDFSKFSYVLFLATKGETSGILKTFITGIENQLDFKVKVIKSDNGTEFKNSVMTQFCDAKGIKREYSVARTPQQNKVAERRNRTLIEAARTMDNLGKFEGKADEGYFVGKPLHMLYMDLVGPTTVKSLMKKSYCLVITDDFSKFSYVLFLATKGETSGILKTFITGIENQLDFKVKVIKSDNGTEFKNSVMTQFCDAKGIKREYSVARTPQQNKVAERRNRTLIEAART